MSVKASISISEQQDTFVRNLVEQGHYSSVSAVMQSGLELLRFQTELKEAELAGLRALLLQREAGELVSAEDARADTSAMLAAKRAENGL